MSKLAKNLVFIGIIVLVIGIIFYIFNSQSNQDASAHLTLGEMQFLSDNALMYSQKTCGHCITQKAILTAELQYHNINKKFEEYFKEFDCSESLENNNICFHNQDITKNIVGTPSWDIKGKRYTGVLTIQELKDVIKQNS